MLLGALEAGTDQLVAHVFEAASLLTWLVTSPIEVRPPGRPNDSAADSRRPLRAGENVCLPSVQLPLLIGLHAVPSEQRNCVCPLTMSSLANLGSSNIWSMPMFRLPVKFRVQQ